MTTPNSPKSEIESYQRTLQRAGFYLGDIDGEWGPKTQRAHEAYQASLVAHKAPDETPESSSVALVGIRNAIVATAQHFLNLTETAPNARWDDIATSGPDTRAAELRQALLDTGWQLGWAYCAAFSEVCWRAAYRNRPELPLISRSITPSVMATFENFERLGRITKQPAPGALMLMQHGQSWQGHAGIVLGAQDGRLVTIEGNTSPAVASREGDGVYRKEKALDFTPSSSRLWLRGFVNPFLI